MDSTKTDRVIKSRSYRGDYIRIEPSAKLYRTEFIQGPEQSSVIDRLTFGWVTGVVSLGNQKSLDQSDLFELESKKGAEYLTVKLEREWEKTKKRAANVDSEPRLWKTVFSLIPISEYLSLSFAAFTESVCRILQPVFLGLLLLELMEAAGQGWTWAHSGWALLFALGICLNAVIMSAVSQQFTFIALSQGMRCRVAITGALYRKVLSLNQKSLPQSIVCEVSNLVSSDVHRLELFFQIAMFLVRAPVELILVAAFMWLLLGSPSLLGLVFMISIIPIESRMANISENLRLKILSHTGQRLTVTREVLSHIHEVKLNTWESPLHSVICDHRRKEMETMSTASGVLSVLLQLSKLSLLLGIFISLITMFAMGVALTPFQVFTTIAFLISVRVSLVKQFPHSLRFSLECFAILKKIQDILELERKPYLGKSVSTTKSLRARKKLAGAFGSDVAFPQEKVVKESPGEGKGGPFVSMEDVTCFWSQESDPVLIGVTLKASLQGLVLVCGPRRSGKTSCLLSILNELPPASGNIRRNGTLTYMCGSKPWIFSGTLRQNILFGKDYMPKLYDQVLQSCGLEEEIDMLPSGDLTGLGYRGVSLNESQRARVSLARAVYTQAEIYLLDDPCIKISDAVVRRRLFKQCICGLLSDRIRIVVCAQPPLYCEKDWEQTIVIECGRIKDENLFSGVASAVDVEAIPLEDEESGHKDIELETPGEGLARDNGFPQTADALDESNQQWERNEYIGEDEELSSPPVSFTTYYRYLRSGTHAFFLACLMFLFVITQGSFIATDLWLALWAQQTPTASPNGKYIPVYVILMFCTSVLALIRAYVFFLALYRSAEVLHNNLLMALLKRPVNFFSSSTTARVMDIFTKDIGHLDESLPKLLLYALQHGVLIVGAIVLSCIINFWIIIAVLPLTIIFVLVNKFYLKTFQKLSWLEEINRGAVLNHFSETLQGLVTIRAAEKEEFTDLLYSYQNRESKAWLSMTAFHRWLALRLEMIGVAFLSAVALSAVFATADAALTGLAMVYALQLVSSIHWAVHEGIITYNLMTSVERILKFSSLPGEPGYETRAKPISTWPVNATCTFNNLTDAKNVIKNLSFVLKAREKVAIVGRESEKSAILSAVLHLARPSGCIIIDNIDIFNINIQFLRSCISVILREPFLFSGKLRTNLDPAERFKDFKLWKALETVHLKSLIESLPGQLYYNITSSEEAFSTSQKQLICLARALLQGNKILVLYDALVNVDQETCELIQDIIRSKFRDATVISLTNRLDTIVDFHRVMILDKGEIVEFEPPENLLQRESLFSRLYYKHHSE